MRTTLTLDDDVSVMLKKMQTEENLSFKEAVNQVLRRGLYQREKKEATVYKQKSFDLGKARLDLDNVGEVLAVIESEDYR